MEIVGVIPAAGHGTRLQPLECSKEVLTVEGRPMMDYIVERMRAGGCTRLRVVTRPEKEDVVARAKELGAEVVVGYPASVSESFIAGMRGLASQDIVLVGFPDTVWEPKDGYLPLVHAVDGRCEVALGLFRIDPSDLPRSDVVVLDEDGAVLRIDVKPQEPQSEWIWGCAAARVRTLADLERSEWPGEYFDLLCREGRSVLGLPLSDIWLDMGTKEALARVASLNDSDDAD